MKEREIWQHVQITLIEMLDVYSSGERKSD
jgi:hypothetical protein